MAPLAHRDMNSAERDLVYVVAGMTCDHCKVAVTEEVTQVAGVRSVDVDLETKLVRPWDGRG